MRQTLSEYCMRSGKESLLRQWNSARNGPLTPDQVIYGSSKKVWWVCDSGHEWEAMVKSRVAGCGCPVCANRRLAPGINDLAAVHPELSKQWHPEKNGALTPSDVMAGSRRKVWWRCEAGHEWQATVCSRAEGRGCPVCEGKSVLLGENDLASRYPAIAEQWHPTRNGTLKPTEVTAYSNRRVWWQCAEGHAYRAPISHRTSREDGCPYCAGRRVLAGFNDLQTQQPQVAAQWHPTLNAPLTPAEVTPGSRRKVWWQCEAGHVWKAAIYSRTGTQKCGCPVCAGRVRTARVRYGAQTQTPAVMSGL